MAVTDYRTLTYIRSVNGTKQYINTGVNYNANNAVRVVAQGVSTSATGGKSVTGQMFKSGWYLNVWNQNGYWCVRNYTGSADEDYHSSIDITTKTTIYVNKKVLYINGSSVKTFSDVASSSSNNLAIFNNKVSEGSDGAWTVYSWEHWKNGTKDRNMVPARRISDSVVGMYDTINNVFYTNSGSGSFTAGSYVTYTLTLTAGTGGTVSGGGKMYQNPDGKARFTAKATANSGYRFVGWYSNSSYTTLVSSSTSYSSTMTANLTLYAKFIAQYTVTASISPTGGGTVTGTGTYDTGTSVTVVATPATDYSFVNWTSNGTVVSTSASYTFTLSSATALIANFKKNGNIHLKLNGSWVNGMMYFKVNGQWVEGKPYIKVNGQWKEGI